MFSFGKNNVILMSSLRVGLALVVLGAAYPSTAYASGSAAAAQTHEVILTLEELADREDIVVPPTKDGTPAPDGDYVSGGCTVHVNKEKIEIKNRAEPLCGPWKAVEGAAFVLGSTTLNVTLSLAKPGSETKTFPVSADDDELVLPADFGDVDKIFWLAPAGWESASATGRRFEMNALLGRLQESPGEAQSVYVSRGGDVDVVRMKLRKDEENPPMRMTCNGLSERFDVCVEVDEKRRFRHFFSARRSSLILPPNTRIRLVVIAPTDMAVEATMGGQRGLYEPPTRNVVEKAAAAQTEGDVQPAESVVSDWSFAPRLPGDADLKIVATGADGKQTADHIEFIVERSYSGALRLGIGVVFSSAVDREYDVATIDGSRQTEIVAKSGGRSEFELVLGYAPYAFDYMAGNRGRRYVGQTLRERAAGFAPYFGLGLLDVNRTGVQVMKSVHLGIEWEPLPNFSIALTAVGRRVSRLADGLTVGSPADSVRTRERLSWGVGLVLNLTPEFFHFATRESSKFFGGSN